MTFAGTMEGLSPLMAWFLIRILAIAMNRAAGTPLPETSAVIMARWVSSARKKS